MFILTLPLTLTGHRIDDRPCVQTIAVSASHLRQIISIITSFKLTVSLILSFQHTAGPDLKKAQGAQTSHQTLSVLFLANDRYQRNYNLVVAHY